MQTTTNTAAQTISLDRTATSAAGRKFSAYGPVDGQFVTWDHHDAEYRGRFDQAEDAVDLMHELANS
jgi:hypothetical protein